MELVVSNITRLIDLPGTELAQLMGEEDPQLPGGTGIASGLIRSLMSLKRKGGACCVLANSFSLGLDTQVFLSVICAM